MRRRKKEVPMVQWSGSVPFKARRFKVAKAEVSAELKTRLTTDSRK